ncbi:MAG: hypothetical protein PHU25_22525 [Deltaproteobacteria bacterium]|nr:hypothetical protein [Deltaproteobacteria bacterium]
MSPAGGRRMRLALLAVAIGTAFAALGAADTIERPIGPPSPPSAAMLRRAVGDPDPGVLPRLARAVAPRDLVLAMYGGTRAERLVAIDAAAYLTDPWPVFPYLAALTAAGERETASRSAGSLLFALHRAACGPEGPADVVSGQVAALADQLAAVAKDVRLEPDLRTSALAALPLLARVVPFSQPAPIALLEDREAEVRRAALGIIGPPVAEAALGALARMAENDPDPILRGSAAALLCENALAHGVAALSADLHKLVAAVLSNGRTPAAGIAPVLVCLARFPSAARADLVDAALKNPDPALPAFWDAIADKAP